MASHSFEIERKYELKDPHARLETIPWSFKNWQLSPAESHQLEATYYDTAQGDLAASKIALRRRLGGSDQGWHVKFDEAGKRHELSFPLEKKDQNLPAALAALLSLATGRSALEPILTLSTLRTRQILQGDRGQDLAEICQDQVRSFDYARGQERKWQEWEVEILPGAQKDSALIQEVFSQLEDQLQAAGLHPSKSPAKLARALGQDLDFEARLQAAEGAKQKKKDGKKKKKGQESSPQLPDALEALSSILKLHTARLVRTDLLVRVGAPDSTHQARVSARQLRSILKYMVLPYARTQAQAQQIKEVLAGLKAYARQLEPHRNGELMLPMVEQALTVPSLQEQLPSFRLLMGQQQEQALAQAQAYLVSDKPYDLHLALREVNNQLAELVDLPLNGENYLNKVAKRLRKSLQKVGERALGSWPDSALTFSEGEVWDEGLHDVRKLAKAVRYCLTACAEAGLPLTEPQTNLLARARAVQSTLGDLTDELTLQGWILEQRKRPEACGLDGFALGYLLGRSQVYAVGLRLDLFTALPKTLKKVSSLVLL